MINKNSSSEDLKRQLNPSQWDAVSTTEGPLLVVAGAGTGKTRVIEYRCLSMVKAGIDPQSILLLTFTRKAAREMLARASVHDPLCRKIEGGTFHSFAYRVIRKYKKALGFQGNISFLDESDSADVLHLLATKLSLVEERTRFPKKATVVRILSSSVNRNQPIKNVLAQDYPHFLHLAPSLETLRKAYVQYKIARSLIDYDDMLIYLRFCLQDKVINEKISSRYKYIMVDEYQDTNKLQADIVYALCQRHHNCMVVGDDTQSIYSFRGAYYKNMFDFPAKFTDTKIVKLEYNYRSTQPILDVANALIEGERQKYSKVLFTTCEGGEPPTLSFFKDIHCEAEWVASRVKEYYDRGEPLCSIGVLYRSNFHSLPLQLAFSKRNIPFVVYGGMKFIETAHIKDALAFLKVHHNTKDEVALSRVLMLLDGVGPKTAEKIKEFAVMKDRAGVRRLLEGALRSESVIRKLLEIVDLFIALDRTSDVENKVKKIIRLYTPYLKAKFDDFPARQDDLKAFAEIAAGYPTVEQFLVDFVTIEPPERSLYGVKAKKEDERPLTLSTIHSAKGLEWGSVFIVALIDGNLPVSYALDNEEMVEEERRLLYVAVTRAKRRLHMSMHNEGRQGGMSSFNKLSRFINEERVMQKLDVKGTWFEEEIEEDHLCSSRTNRRDLYERMVDYLDYGQEQDPI